MNKKSFTNEDYINLLRRLMDASDAHDGQALQSLECEIIDTLKDTTMSIANYRSLMGVQQILLDNWRRNDK